MSELLRPAGHDGPRVAVARRRARRRSSTTSHELEAFWAEAPWRVRVERAGEAAVLVRWREHLDILAIKGLWCAERRVPLLLEDLRAVARAQGFGRLLLAAAARRRRAAVRGRGHAACRRSSSCCGSSRASGACCSSAPDAAARRCASAPSGTSTRSLDRRRAAFEPFWRYDRADAARATSARSGSASPRSAGEVVGYTLCTVRRGEGSLGRLAVVPRAAGLAASGRCCSRTRSAYPRAGAAPTR